MIKLFLCAKKPVINNEDISRSIKTRDANTQSDTQPSFNHGTINNNLNLENILNQFNELEARN